MIQEYDPDSTYEIFEIQNNGNQYKIGEIECNTYFDLDKRGKRIPKGFAFSNDEYFWKQFNNIKVKTTNRPLGGLEPLVWGAYWFVSALITVGLVSVGSNLDAQVFWIVTSAIHIGLTIKYRRNRIVLYWMGAMTVVLVFVAVAFVAGGKD